MSDGFPEPSFTVVSTFAGCGGSSLGYRWSGGRVLAAIEWDEHAAECYRLNFPDTNVLNVDIKALSGEDVMREARLSGPSELDVLDGSPPCQGFSTAGKRVYYDERNNLFSDYVRLLGELQPKVCVMENVSGLVKGKMRLIFVEMLRAIRAAGDYGYVVSAKLLDAKYLGVPQSRQRVIFVGVRRDLAERCDVWPSHPPPANPPIPLRDALPSLGGGQRMFHDTGGFVRDKDVTDGPSPALTIGVDSLNARHYQIEEEAQREIDARALERRRSSASAPDLPECTDKPSPTLAVRGAPHIVIEEARARMTEQGTWGKAGQDFTDKPAPTLNTGPPQQIVIEEPPPPSLDDKYGKRWDEVSVGSGLNESDRWKGPGQSCYKPDPTKPSPALPSTQTGRGFASFVHPRKRRALTIAEAKIIMSFPEDFRLTGSYSQQWARLGNAVPPVMMRHVASHLRDHVLAAIEKCSR